jgi:ankyrin repeat protein
MLYRLPKNEYVGIPGKRYQNTAGQVRSYFVDKLLQFDPALVNSQESNSGLTPVHAACVYSQSDVVQLLTEANADVNMADKRGVTPLHTAVNLKDLTLIDILLNANANPDTLDVNGNTPLHAAIKCQSKEVVKLLWETF